MQNKISNTKVQYTTCVKNVSSFKATKNMRNKVDVAYILMIFKVTMNQIMSLSVLMEKS